MLPVMYLGASTLLAAVVLVIMYGAGAMQGYEDEVVPVPDSQFKVFLNGDDKLIEGDKFWFRNPGSSTSGSDWSQGWECSGE